MDVYIDDLAHAVERDERRRLDQLSAGEGTVIDLEIDITAGQRLIGQDGTIAVDLRHLGDMVAEMNAPARTVLLGAPGAGKTVAAIYLLLALLARRAQLPDAARVRTPVPVRVNAAGWDGTDLSAWLVYRLRIDYAQHPRVIRKLIAEGRILPVLDGLDEMDDPVPDTTLEPMPHARAAIDAFNSTPWRNQPIVITCRTTDFRRLQEARGDGGVYGATTLTLQPMTPEVVVDYLAGYRDQLDAPSPPWDAVTDRIIDDPDGPLAAALSTPWLLSLTASALHTTPAIGHTLAVGRSPTEIGEYLFATLIPAAIATIDRTDRKSVSYTRRDVRNWLTTLAIHLSQTSDNAIRLNQLWRIDGRRPQALHGLMVALAAGLLAAGLMVVLAIGAGLTIGLTGGLTIGLTGGLTIGLTFLFFFGLFDAELPSAGRLAWHVPDRSRWFPGLVFGLGSGLAAGLVVWLIFPLTVGLAFGLVSGLLNGLTIGLGTTDADRLRLGQDETRIIRYDVIFGLATGLAAGLGSGLVVGLATTLRVGLTTGITVGLGSGLVVGLAVGLVNGAASARYAFACLGFRVSRAFAARPAVFLNWSRRAGLLRVTGTAYQFRHASFQQWLIAQAESAADAPPGGAGSRR